MNTAGKYLLRGVSSDKTEVLNVVECFDKGIFPDAFCKILPDIAGNNKHWCNIMHADTAGTKTVLAYLYWKETGDNTVWKGIVQDAVVMNLDDMACAGITDHFILSSTIGRNRNRIPGSVVNDLIRGTKTFAGELVKMGIRVHISGGETADVGDVVRTLDVGFTAFARIKKKDVIETRIRAGDIIVGLASSGIAAYEKEYNSGIGCNGLTSARHELLSGGLAEKYPESYDPEIPGDLLYTGSKKLTDMDPGTGMTIGKLLLSPTRTYLPVIRKVICRCRKGLHAIIHCTGGGQTKVLRFISNIHIIKDNLFDPPPLFCMIRKESGTPWREMYQVFNMGHRMEIYATPDEAQKIIDIAAQFNIKARIIGRCEPYKGRKLTITGPEGPENYE